MVDCSNQLCGGLLCGRQYLLQTPAISEFDQVFTPTLDDPVVNRICNLLYRTKTIPDKKLGKIKKTDAETPGIRHPRTGGKANGLKRSQKHIHLLIMVLNFLQSAERLIPSNSDAFDLFPPVAFNALRM